MLRDKDGNSYTSVIIGTQEWLLEYYKTTKYSNGDNIPLVTDGTEWANVGKTDCLFGPLYNWYVVSNTHGIAPAGWHVPTKTEWDTLITQLGGLSIAGKHIKESGTKFWSAGNTGDNSSGFSALGTGWRDYFDGLFYNYLNECDFWASTEQNIDVADAVWVLVNEDNITSFNNYKNLGFSIRLIKNSTSLTNGQTSTMSDPEGNVYPTICIGSQEWMSVNLNSKKYIDGTPIPNITGDSEWINDKTGALCWYNNVEGTCSDLDAYCWQSNDIANKLYGALYNFHAINHGVVNPGIDFVYLERDYVPETTWRVALNADFAKLGVYLGGDTVAGGAMKEVGTTHWTTPNTDASNSSGFTALPGGWRDDAGSFAGLGTANIMGTSQEYDAVSSYYAKLNYNDGVLLDETIYLNKKYGLSVRLVRDYNPVAPPVIPQPPYQVGNFPDYRFYISDASSVTYEVFPLNFLSTSLIDEREQGKIFYRRKFNGTLIFGTNSRVKDLEGVSHNRCDDFEIFWIYEQFDPCAKLYLDIHKVVNGIVSEYWHGYFSTTDGTWNLDQKTFEVNPLPNDDFTIILDETDTKYDILVNTSEISTTANDGVINQVYNHGHWLMDVITYLGSQIAPGATISSTFFTASTNPVTLLTSLTTKLLIFQKSDVIRPTATNKSVNGLLSWNELMDILFGMFQVTWNYDALLHTINVEHISAYPITPLGEIDIRTQQSCLATNKYSYVKEEMPRFEEFSFMEAGDINFVGVPIWYQSACLNPTATKKTAVNITTDLTHIWLHNEAIEDSGWVILANEGSVPYTVEISVGELSPTTLLNMSLSWANLQANYFRHNRVLIEGYINNDLMQFATSQKLKQQECDVIFCNPFIPDDQIKTELGMTYFDGERATVKTANVKPSGETHLILRYGSKNYNLTPPPTPKKWIRIIMSGCTHFDAQLSEAAPVGGLPVEFHYLIYDSAKNLVCQNSAPWDIWTISAGSLVASYDLTLCDVIPVGGCIYFVYPDYNTISGWNTYFIYDENCRCIL
jgi:uncharacterized protein (TIGR02145 family)